VAAPQGLQLREELATKEIICMTTILVTGCAGFIGFHVTRRLLQCGYEVVGFDNMSPFYDEGLKNARLGLIRQHPRFEFIKCDLVDRDSIGQLFHRHKFDAVIHLAAQAGVRFSLENPHLYIDSNVTGFVNLIEEARKHSLSHFVFASSSSVYGCNKKIPFSESDNVDHPISLYAATKKTNELIAHVYAHLYGLLVTGLRFFTVYGPWGRPDMAIFTFCRSIFDGMPIQLYDYGNMQRDFTYVDDVVEGIIRVTEDPPLASPNVDKSPNVSPKYRIYNIGNNQPIELTKLIRLLEDKTGKKARLELLPMQPGDVPVTFASIDQLSHTIRYQPSTPIAEGISRFVDWYRSYYNLK
jgi:UDP-glucuronate 4-epimerase